MMDFEKWYMDIFLPEQINEPSREMKSAIKFAYNEGCFSSTKTMQAKNQADEKELKLYRKYLTQFYNHLKAEIDEKDREIKYLRQHGNKDCTAQADEAMKKGE